MLRTWRLLVSDTTTGSGYAYLNERGQRRAAGRDQPAYGDPAAVGSPGRGTASEAAVPHVTGANQWVLDVGFAARLELHQEGYLGLRGMKPPAPYVHNGALL